MPTKKATARPQNTLRKPVPELIRLVEALAEADAVRDHRMASNAHKTQKSAKL